MTPLGLIGTLGWTCTVAEVSQSSLHFVPARSARRACWQSLHKHQEVADLRHTSHSSACSVQDDAPGEVRPDLHRLHSWDGHPRRAAVAARPQVGRQSASFLEADPKDDTVTSGYACCCGGQKYLRVGKKLLEA